MKNRHEYRSRCISSLLLILTFVVFTGLLGCGKPELGEVEVTPAEKTLTVGESLSFKAFARSTKGKEMIDMVVTWHVEGEAGTIGASGLFKADKPGNALVVASADGVSGKARVSVQPPVVAGLKIESDQTEAYPATKVKITLSAVAGGDKPAGYSQVMVSTPTAGAALSAEKAVLDADGKAALELATPEAPGEVIVEVSAAGIKQQLLLQVKPRPVAKLEAQPQVLEAAVGSQVAFAIKALAENDLPAGYNQLSISTPSEGVVIHQQALILDGNGQASFKVTTPAKPGPVVVVAASGEKKIEIPLTVVPRPVAKLEAQPATERTIAASDVKVTVRAYADGEQPAGYNTVTLAARSEGTRVSNDTVALHPNGEGTFSVILAPAPGDNVITLSSGGVTAQLNIEGTAVSRLVISPAPEEYETGQKIVFGAVGQDSYGNSLPVQPEWWLSGENAAIEADGVITMQSPGTGILFAQFKDVKVGQPFTVVPGKAAKLVVEPEGVRLKAGESALFIGKVFNAQDYPVTAQVEWSVQGDVGTIDSDGAFMANTAGEGKVVATSGDAVTAIPVTVEHGGLAAIAFDLDQEVISAGTPVSLTAEGIDAFGNRFAIQPEWLLSTSLGIIDPARSVFTPQHAGSGDIIAKIGNVLKKVAIKIVPDKLARLEIIPQNVDVIAGESVQFEVQGLDRFGNSVAITPQYSISQPLGALDPTGLLKTLQSGNAVVQASAQELVAESTVTVAPAEMERAVLSPEGPMALKAGDAQLLSVSGFDKLGNAVQTVVVWEVSPALGSIDAQGALHPEKAGKGKILATITQVRTGKEIELATDISIIAGETTKIVVAPNPVRVVAGEEVMFEARAFDRFGNATDAYFKWQLEPSQLGNLAQDGRFSAVRATSGKVLVRFGNVVGSADIEILPAEAAFLKIIPEGISLEAGELLRLEPIIEDKFGNVVPGNVLWNLTDSSLAVIDSDNRMVAQRTGEGELLATFQSLVATVPVKIKAGPLHTIALKPGDQTIAAGATVQLEAAGFDAGGNPIDAAFTWSVAEPVGRIDADGLFTAEKVGKGTVEARSGEVAQSAMLKVIPGKPAVIKFAPETIALTAGETQVLNFEVFDAYDNFIPSPDYRFEVEKGLGSVSGENVFRAQKAGEGFVRLRVGDVSAQSAAKIVPGAIALVVVSPAQVQLSAGEQQALSAVGYDAQGNLLDLAPRWSVVGHIGTIEDAGAFKATTAGDGFVLARMDTATGVTAVKVDPGPVARVVVKPATADLRAGESVGFSAAAFDAFNNVTSADFTWAFEGDPALGEWTPEALFKAIHAGVGKVTATADGVIGVAPIKVEAGDLKQIVLSPDHINLKSAEQVQIAVYGLDAFGNRLDVTPRCTVEPATLGSMDTSTMNLTGLVAGKGRLLAAVDGIRASAPVKVVPGALTAIRINLPEQKFMAGKTYQLTATGYDMGQNVVPLNVEWAVTQDIGAIDRKSGLFHARKVGKGLVAAYSGRIETARRVEVYPGDLYSLFIAPNPVTVRSNTLQTFTVSGLDVEKNAVPLSEAAVEWDAVGGIGVMEKPGVFQGTMMGKGKVLASSGNLLAEAYVAVVPGAADVSNCRIRVTYPTLPADGKSYSEIIVEVRDANYNPVPGVNATLVSSRQNDMITQPGATGAAGTARGRISSTETGLATVRAVVDGAAFADTAPVTFE